tara:strand:- start:1619 stop:1921 length:303 start_codon:yes stop_codon:yes gene_type:complete
MTIRLHENLKYSQPFDIAECSLNCPQDLCDLFYGKADRFMNDYEQKFAEKLGYKNISHWKQDGNTPSDYMQLVNIGKIWRHFTDEEKRKINAFAKIVQWA